MSRVRFRPAVLLVAGSLVVFVAGSGRGLDNRTWGDSADADRADVVPAAPTISTVVVLPDTQYYASSFPFIFAAQTRWIVEQQSERNIALAIHLGDIVDASNDQAQWTVANSSMRVMDGLVPYVLVPGNHGTDANRVGPIDDYFAPATMPWITGTMTAGRIENSYSLVNIGPRQWLVLGLEFGPRDAVLAWADRVLKAHPAIPAIIVTHAYLDFSLAHASAQHLVCETARRRLHDSGGNADRHRVHPQQRGQDSCSAQRSRSRDCRSCFTGPHLRECSR